LPAIHRYLVGTRGRIVSRGRNGGQELIDYLWRANGIVRPTRADSREGVDERNGGRRGQSDSRFRD
jgi:hypothetical protein